MEQELEILTTTSKKGAEYKNLNLKTKVNRSTGGVVAGLEVGNHIVVEKVFPEGYENIQKYKQADGSMKEVKSYSCKVVYKGEEVSFWLTEQEHNEYALIGDAGDDVMLELTQTTYKFGGEERPKFVIVTKPVA